MIRKNSCQGKNAESAFHLSALEATYIKTLKPAYLCRQEAFVYFLQISH